MNETNLAGYVTTSRDLTISKREASKATERFREARCGVALTGHSSITGSEVELEKKRDTVKRHPSAMRKKMSACKSFTGN